LPACLPACLLPACMSILLIRCPSISLLLSFFLPYSLSLSSFPSLSFVSAHRSLVCLFYIYLSFCFSSSSVSYFSVCMFVSLSISLSLSHWLVLVGLKAAGLGLVGHKAAGLGLVGLRAAVTHSSKSHSVLFLSPLSQSLYLYVCFSLSLFLFSVAYQLSLKHGQTYGLFLGYHPHSLYSGLFVLVSSLLSCLSLLQREREGDRCIYVFV